MTQIRTIMLAVVLTTLLSGCGPSVDPKFKAFWGEYKETLANGNQEEVLETMVFPFLGAEFLKGKISGKAGMTREEISGIYDLLYSEEALNTITSSSASDLESYTVQDASTSKMMGMPVDQTGYKLETKSAVFHYGPYGDSFKLYFIERN